MIIRSAYLQVSPLGAFAVIIFKDGSRSQGLGTKRQALAIAESMFEVKLDEFELKAVKEQIHGSTLIAQSEALETFCDEMSNRMDEFERAIQKFIASHEEGEGWKQ